MIRLLVLAIVLALPLTVFGQCPNGQCNRTADAAYGVAYVQTRIVEMPQDQNKPYLTVIGDATDPNIKMVLNWFSTNTDLIAIKSQTHFVVMPTVGDTKPARFYRDRYAKTVKETPCIRFQKADGRIIVELKPHEIPATPEALVNALNRPATECFGRRQSCPNPAPSPDRDPEPQPLDRREPTNPTPSRFPWIALIALSTVGAGAGVGHQYYVTYKNS